MQRINFWLMHQCNSFPPFKRQKKLRLDLFLNSKKFGAKKKGGSRLRYEGAFQVH